MNNEIYTIYFHIFNGGFVFEYDPVKQICNISLSILGNSISHKMKIPPSEIIDMFLYIDKILKNSAMSDSLILPISDLTIKYFTDALGNIDINIHNNLLNWQGTVDQQHAVSWSSNCTKFINKILLTQM